MLLVLLVALFHGPALNDGFVYDDHWTIIDNAFLRRPANVLSVLSPEPARQMVPDAGRPTLLISELFDHALWGLSPRGWHGQNLFWHAAVVAAFFVGLCGLGTGFLIAFTAAAMFAVHPMSVEAVAAVNYREDLLAAFFILASLAAVAAARRPSRGRAWSLGMRAVAVLSLLLAIFAKENAAVAPILLVLIDLHLESAARIRQFLRRVPDYLLLLVPVVLGFAWRGWVQGGFAIVSRTAEIPAAHQAFPQTFLSGARTLVAGIAQIAVPVAFSPDYADPSEGKAAIALGVATVLALCAGLVVAIRLGRRQPLVGLGLLFGVAAYLPHLGLVPLTNLRADRYFYVSSMGFLLAAAALLDAAFKRLRWCAGAAVFDLPRPLLVVAVLALILGGRTLAQGRIWRNDLALWSHAVAIDATSARAWAGLADARLRRGESVEALRAVERSLALADDGHGRELRGIILMQAGDLLHAHGDLSRALSSTPPHHRAELLNNLGYCELLLKRPGDALTRFDEARRLAPRFDRPWLNAARAHDDLGEPAAAVETIRQLTQLMPESEDGKAELHRRLERLQAPAAPP